MGLLGKRYSRKFIALYNLTLLLEQKDYKNMVEDTPFNLFELKKFLLTLLS